MVCGCVFDSDMWSHLREIEDWMKDVSESVSTEERKEEIMTYMIEIGFNLIKVCLFTHVYSLGIFVN